MDDISKPRSIVNDVAFRTRSRLSLQGGLGRMAQGSSPATLGVVEMPALLSSLPDPVFVLDRDGRIAMLSDAWEKMTGMAVPDALGRPLAAMAHPADAPDVRFQLSALLCGVMASWRGTFRVSTARRGSVWVEVHASPSEPRPGGSMTVVGTLRDVTFAREREQDLRRLSLHDTLVDLPNRTLLLDRLESRCARYSRRKAPLFALAFVDLDGFKSINDRLGHLVGDQALTVAATRLTGAVRASDTVARFGGDEFAVLLDEVHDPHDAVRLAGHMCDAMRRPLRLGGESIDLSCSIGVVVSDTSFEAASDLVGFADEAMYEAKREGGVAVLYTDPRQCLQPPCAPVSG